jgi:hydroxyacylglutathione hydrolase
MIFEKDKSKIVAHISYFIGSGREAFVVDPRRDIDIYLKLALKHGVNIKYVFETHRNEDYVIGSLELADKTGAIIYHGPWPEFKYGTVLYDGQKLSVGNLEIGAIHTPGHTPGCMSYSVTDLETGKDPVLVCTGDTLFIGDTGRTDFGGLVNRRAWSESLYHSIHKKLLPIGDNVILCPAHGSGSVCGSGIAEREFSTLGSERLMNPFLQLSKDDFIDLKVNEHHEYAPYFKKMEQYNLEGAPFIGNISYPKALSLGEFAKMVHDGAVIVDTRPPPSFGAGHIKGSYSINEARLSMSGWVLPYDKPILLVLGNPEHLEYVYRSLLRIGYDNIEGYLHKTMASWYNAAKPVSSFGLTTVMALKEKIDKGVDLMIIDVRNLEEYEEGHIKGCKNFYAGRIAEYMEKIPRDKPVALICKSGTRSGFASSILHRNGFDNIINVLGGMTAWKNAGYPVEK